MSDQSVERLLAVARRELGYEESRGNRTKYGEWFGIDGQPWCAMFTSWCFAQVGLPRNGMTYTAWTPGIYRAARKTVRWHPAEPRPGDLVLFSFSTPSNARPLGISHVGIVERVTSAGVVTLEGNTNEAGSRTGGKVMRKSRRGNIAGYARPASAVVPEGGLMPLTPASPKQEIADLQYDMDRAAQIMGWDEYPTLGRSGWDGDWGPKTRNSVAHIQQKIFGTVRDDNYAGESFQRRLAALLRP